MTKERLIKIQTRRGYEVEDLGRVVFFRMNRYTATWFFLPDGSVDESNPPTWRLERA